MIFTNLVQANLRTKTLGKVIEYYSQLDSTNEEAWEMIDEGVKSGTVIITDRQLSGKGRNGTKWQSKANRSLTFSVVIKPNNLSGSMSGVFPLLTGVAIVRALHDMHIDGGLKWPNDIMVKGKKLGGILCESRIQGKSIKWVVIGIGINVNQVGFGDLNAISLKAILKETFSVYEELFTTFSFMNEVYNALRKGEDLRKEYLSHLIGVDKEILFDDGEQFMSKVVEVDDFGALVLNKNGLLKKYGVKEVKFLNL